MATDVKNDASLSTSLVSYWELEESSGTRVDSHGSNDLSDNNTVLQGTGKQGNCADFELDNSEYLSIADASQSGLDFSDAISISMWVKFETKATYQTLLSKLVSAASSRSYTFRYFSTDDIAFYSSYDGNSYGCLTSVSWTPVVDTWYHLVMTKTGTSVKFYVDGSQQGTTQTCSNGTIHNSSTQFKLSGNADGDEYFDGLMDEVGVWSKELSSSEVTALYNSGSGIPYDAGAVGVVPTLTLLNVG